MLLALIVLLAVGDSPGADDANRPEREPQPASLRAVDVVCNVENGGTILFLPEGKSVKKGDVACELDAAGLNDRLIEETVASRRAEGEYKTAHLAHEVAMTAVKEYSESTYLLKKATIQRDVKLAESELAQAQDQLDLVQRAFEKGTASKAQRVASELSFQRARFALEVAQMKLNHLEEFGRPNTVKRLFGEVERTRALELAAKDIHELRHAREQKTRRQVAACRIAAPCDGRMAYAMRPPGPGEGQDPVPIREGDHVRERQVVLRIIPPSP
jgi:hypothetical protein